MKKSILAAGVLILSLAVGLCAEKVTNFKIFESAVYTIQPQMEVVLALTPDQQAGIQAAYEVMERDPAVTEARAAFKASDGQKTPEADAAKKTFYVAQEQSFAKYRQALDSILTGAQKDLITTLNVFSKEIWNATSKDVTWKERTADLHGKGTARLPEVLNPEQIQLLGVRQEK